MVDSFAGFANKIEAISRDLSDRATMTRIGMDAKRDAVEAVRSDIGDTSMSNWRRGRPIDIGARFDVKSDTQVEVSAAPRARGPWRVLEEGRKAGQSRGRRGRPGRRYGASRGKGTWSDAVSLMEARTPARLHREVRVVLGRHLRG